MASLLAGPRRLLRNLTRIAAVTLVLVALYLALDALLLPGEPRGRPAA
jgi:hypothetical protein